MSAKTSLARQLELLKLPQTSVHKETHGSASFLYHFDEAKSIDADTHYSVALSGLEGLIQIDQQLVEPFKNSLFHESSKKFDRGVASKEENEKIDCLIEEYLFTVATRYFQHTDTHKTIEWLIYRYKVNEYNTDALIGSVLPHHETRLFVRLLQTCSAVKNPNNTRWYWLRSVQESGVPLAKPVLLQHCVSDPEFAHYVTDSVFKGMHIDATNPFFPSFLVSFCLNLLERSTSERTIATSTYVISRAIRSNCQSLFVAGYLIFSHLCMVTKLELKVVEKILSSLLRHIKPDVFQRTLLAMNIACHTQGVQALPIKFVNEDIVTNLVAHSKSYNFEPLIKSLLLSIVVVATNETNPNLLKLYKNYSQQLLQTKGVSERTVHSLLAAITEALEQDSNEDKVPAEANELLSHFVCLIEKLFPAWFDSAIASLQSVELLTTLLSNARYSFVEKASVPLFVGLEHGSKRVRRQSMLHLAQNLDTFLDENNEANIKYLKHVIKSNLLNDLSTSTPDVLLYIFGIKTKLFNLFSPNEFEKIVSQILNVCNQHEYSLEENQLDTDMQEQASKWVQLKQLLLEIYCSRLFEEYHAGQERCLAVINGLFFGQEHSLRLINYLLPTNRNQLAFLEMILKSKFAQTNPLLNIILTQCKSSFKKLSTIDFQPESISLVTSVNRIVLKCVIQFCSDNLPSLLGGQNLAILVKAIQKDACSFQRRTSLLLVFILTEIYRQNQSNSDLGKHILRLLLTQLTYMELDTQSSSKIVSPSDYEKLNMTEQFLSLLGPSLQCTSLPMPLVGYVLHSLIRSINVTLTELDRSSDNVAVNWHLVNQESELFHFKLYNLLLFYAAPSKSSVASKKMNRLCRNMLSFFLSKLIVPEESNAKNETAFNFFLPIISSTSAFYLRTKTLSLMQSLLQIPETASHLVASLQAHPQYLISYLVALSSSLIAFRQLALSNLQIIRNNVNSKCSLAQFVQTILDHEQDILTSEQAISKVLSSVYIKQSDSLAVKLVQNISHLLTDPQAAELSVNLRMSLLCLLVDTDVATKSYIFQSYYDRFFNNQSSTKTRPSLSASDEPELKTLLAYLRKNQDQLFEASGDKRNYICEFYLACVQSTLNGLSEKTSLTVYGLLNKKSFELIRSTNEEFALQLVACMLDVQLKLSESGPSHTTANNLSLIGGIKKQLRRVTNDGVFIVQMLQHLLPIEEIYDTFAYARKEPSSEKRLRRLDLENESKFVSAWKLLRIYVSLFQSRDNIDNCGPLMKTLFDYLKLTFMDVDDNSSEFTRQTILYAIVTCIETNLSIKSAALSQQRSQADGDERDGAPMEVDSEQDQQNLAQFISLINVDIIVDCMRESRLKETQKVALLLISLIAPHFQKQILDYLVAIFTFIGTSLLQCDDQYSLAILFETMESIIPIILRNDKPGNITATQQEQLSESNMKQQIISVFVKSFADIPSYRRLPLFVKLVQLLGEDRFLSILCLRLLEEACLLKTKSSRSEKEVMLSFLQALFSQFLPEVQLSSLCTLLCVFERKFFDHHLKKKSLQKLFVDEQIWQTLEGHQEESRAALSSLKALSDSVCQEFSTKISFDSDKLSCGVEILKFIVSIISNSEFSQSTTQLCEGPLSSLLIYLLNLLLELIVSLGPGDSSMKPSLNMYRKRIKATLDEALLKYHSLLPASKLIEIVIGDLLNNTAQLESSLSGLVKRKSLELLNEKLMKLGAHELDKKLALTVIKSLCQHLTHTNQVNKMDDLQVHNMQLILVSLKFSTKFIPTNMEQPQLSARQAKILSTAFLQVCNLANAIIIEAPTEEDAGEQRSSRCKSMQNLKGSCILCITQLLCTMSLEGIQYLAKVVKLILDNFEVTDEIVLISNVSSLAKLVNKFAQFLSPHLKSIILKLLFAYTLCGKVGGLRSKLQTNWTLLAKLVPKRVMFEVIDASYDEAIAISTHSIVELMTLFRMSCDNLEKTDVDVIMKSFKTFMIKALSYRSIHHKDASLATIEQIETSFGEAFSTFIPKLTEASFRPIFYKLLEWSIQIENYKKFNKKDQSYSLSDECYFRMIAFYRFCSLLADRLKSLFCVFVAPSIFNNCSEMLLAYHSANFEEQSEDEYSDFMTSQPQQQQPKAHEGKLKLRDASLGEPLVGVILSTLSKCFLYDLNGTFVNKDCTSLIVKPIVNQISNVFGSDSDFEFRLGLILNCTQYLIQNNKDEALIKEFNYQILLKTRESNEKIRVGAIKVLHRLILTCSEDYLSFIPEAIPFIAELSEDESELVESHVKKLIIDIEQLVGEPINKYL